MLTQTCPLPAGGAGRLALLFEAEALLDLAGFVEAAEFEDAGAFELAGAEAEAAEFEFEDVDPAADVLLLASASALVDFDFFVLADFVPESHPPAGSYRYRGNAVHLRGLSASFME